MTRPQSSDGATPTGRGQSDLDDMLSTATTATENTPLLRSETSSERTLSPGHRTNRNGLDDQDADSHSMPAIGFNRAICIIFSMWCLIFLQASNMSGMTMTQSIIAADLNAYDRAMWFTSAYLIALASMAPLIGRLSTIFSPGVMTLATSVFFSIGAVISARAQSFAVFIVGRVIIGIGGSGVMTLSMILVLQLTDKRRRGLFIGLVNAGFTIGLSLGAVVFGALLPALGWRLLFLVQSPVGILAGLGVWLSMPYIESPSASGSKDKTTLQKLAGVDYAGAVLLTLTIILFLYGLSGTIQPVPILVSLTTLGLFILTETHYAADPLIPVRVLRSRGVLLSCLAQQGFMACRWTILYYGPIYALAVRGLPAAAAGSVLIPTNLGFGLGGLAVGWLHVRRAGSFYVPSLASLVAFAAATLAASRFASGPNTPAALVVAVLLAHGLATGALLNYSLAHLLHLARPADHFVATSLLATFRGFAGSFGTTIGGGAFARALRASLETGFTDLDGGHRLSPTRRDLVSRLVGSPALVFGGSLDDAERAVAVAGYEVALRRLFAGAAIVSMLMLIVQAGTGWKAPSGAEEEEEEEEEEDADVREALREADETMEA